MLWMGERDPTLLFLNLPASLRRSTVLQVRAIGLPREDGELGSSRAGDRFYAYLHMHRHLDNLSTHHMYPHIAKTRKESSTLSLSDNMTH